MLIIEQSRTQFQSSPCCLCTHPRQLEEGGGRESTRIHQNSERSDCCWFLCADYQRRLTVVVGELVLNVLSEELLDGGGDTHFLFGDVLVMLCVVSLRDSCKPRSDTRDPQKDKSRILGYELLIQNKTLHQAAFMVLSTESDTDCCSLYRILKEPLISFTPLFCLIGELQTVKKPTLLDSAVLHR